MNRMNRRSVVTTIVVFVVCLIIVTGSTFSLFTDYDDVNIAITSGELDVVASIATDTLAVYSKGVEQTEVEDGKHFFQNHGYATLDSESLTITNITPGDGVTFNITIENDSNIDVAYRIVWTCTSEFGEDLTVTANGASVSSGTSQWVTCTKKGTETVEMAIDLSLDAGNDLMDKKASFRFAVEAVQANGTGDWKKDAYVNTADGLQAAVNSGATEITLNDDIDLEKTLVFAPSSTTYSLRSTPIVLDLNGNTISVSDMNAIRNDGAHLQVINGTIERTGTVAGYAFNNAVGMLELNKVEIIGGLYTSGSVLNVTDSSIIQPYSGRHAIYSYNCATTIDSGIFHNDNSGNSTIMAAGSSVVTINGGEFSIKDGRPVQNWTSCLVDSQNGSSIIINGGTFNGGFRTQGGSSMTINNGSFNDVYGSGYNVYTGATVTVNGGVFTDSNAISYANKYVKEDYEIIVDENGNGVLVEKVNEVVVTTIEGLLDAFANAEPGLVIDATGVTYSMNGAEHFTIPAGITLKGLTVTANYRGLNYIMWGEGTDPITFENCTFGETSRNTVLGGTANGPTSVVYNNCTFTGQVITNFVDNADGVATFNNCVFTKAANSMYNFIEAMGGKHIFNNCTFDYTGVNQTSMGVITSGQLNVYSETEYSTYVETNGCKFINCGTRQYGANSTLVRK